MSTSTYGSYPRVTLTWSNNNLSYVVVSYYGNVIVGTGTTTTSSNQTGTSYTTGDLSFNALYTFTLTPYNTAGTAGTAKNFTVNTTPSITGAYSSGVSSTSTAQIQWYGTYYYVKIWRKISSPYTTGYTEVSANTKLYTMPYYDTDLSGNTTYVYYVQPYDSGDNQYSASNTVTVTTSARAATDLSSVFYDSSGIKISFTLPKNSYTSSYYYTLRASNSGTNTDVSGSTSPLFVKGLTSETTYSCYILTYLDGVLGSTSSVLSVTTASTGYLASVKSTFFYPFITNAYNYNTGTGSSTNPPTTNSISYSTTYYKLGTGSLYLSASTSYVNLPSFTNTSSGMTVCMWLYQTSSAGGWDRIFHFTQSTASYSYAFSLVENLSSKYTFQGYGANYPSTISVTTNSWVHVALTTYSIGSLVSTTSGISKYNCTYKIYINGTSNTYTCTDYYYTPVTYAYGRIGKNGDSTGDKGITGYINDFRYYDYSLSDSQITSIYNNTTPINK